MQRNISFISKNGRFFCSFNNHLSKDRVVFKFAQARLMKFKGFHPDPFAKYEDQPQ